MIIGFKVYTMLVVKFKSFDGTWGLWVVDCALTYPFVTFMNISATWQDTRCRETILFFFWYTPRGILGARNQRVLHIATPLINQLGTTHRYMLSSNMDPSECPSRQWQPGRTSRYQTAPGASCGGSTEPGKPNTNALDLRSAKTTRWI